MTRYIEGVSTRKVKHITEELCGISFSKSHISELNKGLDEEIILWRNHQLEKEYPYLIVDARYEKVRIGKQVLSQGVSWQRCQVHFCRNLLDCIPRKDKGKIGQELTSIFLKS